MNGAPLLRSADGRWQTRDSFGQRSNNRAFVCHFIVERERAKLCDLIVRATSDAFHPN